MELVDSLSPHPPSSPNFKAGKYILSNVRFLEGMLYNRRVWSLETLGLKYLTYEVPKPNTTKQNLRVEAPGSPLIRRSIDFCDCYFYSPKWTNICHPLRVASWTPLYVHVCVLLLLWLVMAPIIANHTSVLTPVLQLRIWSNPCWNMLVDFNPLASSIEDFFLTEGPL